MKSSWICLVRRALLFSLAMVVPASALDFANGPHQGTWIEGQGAEAREANFDVVSVATYDLEASSGAPRRVGVTLETRIGTLRFRLVYPLDHAQHLQSEGSDLQVLAHVSLILMNEVAQASRVVLTLPFLEMGTRPHKVIFDPRTAFLADLFSGELIILKPGELRLQTATGQSMSLENFLPGAIRIAQKRERESAGASSRCAHLEQ